MTTKKKRTWQQKSFINNLKFNRPTPMLRASNDDYDLSKLVEKKTIKKTKKPKTKKQKSRERERKTVTFIRHQRKIENLAILPEIQTSGNTILKISKLTQKQLDNIYNIIYNNINMDFRHTLKDYPKLIEYFEQYLIEINKDMPQRRGGKRKKYKRKSKKTRKKKRKKKKRKTMRFKRK